MTDPNPIHALARERFVRRPGRGSLAWPAFPASSGDAAPDSLRDLARLREGLRDALEGLDRRRSELTSDPRYTPAGVREMVREHVRGEVQPLLRRARKALADRRETAAQALSALRPVRPLEPTDAAGAIYRMELRGWIRGLAPDERTRLLMTARDADVLDAVLSAPAGLSGVSEELHETLTRRALETRHPQELAEAADFVAALESVEGCVAIVDRAARAELGFAPLREDATADDEAGGDEGGGTRGAA